MGWLVSKSSVQHQTPSPPSRGVGKKGDKGVESIGGVSAPHRGSLQPGRELREEGWNGRQQSQEQREVLGGKAHSLS